MSVTIEGIVKENLKTFADDPLKVHLKSPVIIGRLKIIFVNYFQSKGPQ